MDAVGGIDVSAMGEHRLNHGLIGSDECEVQRGEAEKSAFIGVGATVEQLRDAGRVVLEDFSEQGRRRFEIRNLTG